DKPYQHDRAKRTADNLGSELLEHEQQHHNTDHDTYNEPASRYHIFSQRRYSAQTLNCGGYGNRRRNDTIRQEGSCTDNGRYGQPFTVASHQGIQRKNSALAVVIGLERDKDVFEGGLQCQCPKHAGYTAEDKVPVGLNSFYHQCLECVKRRSSDVAENDSERYQH